jgi:hypothetical protein
MVVGNEGEDVSSVRRFLDDVFSHGDVIPMRVFTGYEDWPYRGQNTPRFPTFLYTGTESDAL